MVPQSGRALRVFQSGHPDSLWDTCSRSVTTTKPTPCNLCPLSKLQFQDYPCHVISDVAYYCDSATSAAYKGPSALPSPPFFTSHNNPNTKGFISLPRPAISYCRRNEASDCRLFFRYTQCPCIRSSPSRFPRKALAKRDLLLLQSFQVIRSFFGEFSSE